MDELDELDEILLIDVEVIEVMLQTDELSESYIDVHSQDEILLLVLEFDEIDDYLVTQVSNEVMVKTEVLVQLGLLNIYHNKKRLY